MGKVELQYNINLKTDFAQLEDEALSDTSEVARKTLSIDKETSMKLIKDLGLRYPTKNSKQKKRYAIFECDNCKKHIKRDIATVERRKQKYCLSCSRIIDPSKKTHGKSQTPTYKIWKAMRARCSTVKKYEGITVCKRWDSYDNFLLDMGERPSVKHSIDRIDNSGNYEPSNCRWATNDIQTANQNLKKTNTSGYTGVYKNWGRWAASITIKKKTIFLGNFDSKIEAANARDKYIIENNLPHRLNLQKES